MKIAGNASSEADLDSEGPRPGGQVVGGAGNSDEAKLEAAGTVL